jgi:hypothetical protein
MSNDYKMNIKQGEDFKLQIEIQDENGDPIDLTGHVFSGQIRETASSATVVAAFSFNILDQSLEPGKVEIILSATTSSAIALPYSPTAIRKLALFSYDIESIHTGNTVRWLEGVVVVSPEVTK